MCQFITISCEEHGGEAIEGLHDTEVAARKQAEELSVLHPLATYKVFQHIGTAKAETRAVWKGAKA